MTERLTDRLSPPARGALETILSAALTVIGTVRPIQAIVDLALPHFDILLLGGLAPQQLCILLSENGIVGDAGAIIPKSSLTSALSRARPKAVARSAAMCGAGSRSASANGDRPQSAAKRHEKSPPAALDFDTPLHAAFGCNQTQPASLPPEPLRTEVRPIKGPGNPSGGPGPPMPRTIESISPTRKRVSALLAIQEQERPYDQD